MDWLEPERSGINEDSVWFDIVIFLDIGFVRDGLGCELYWLRAKREGVGLESSSWGSG